MIKKRIKRALRAIGLVKPLPGSLKAPRGRPNPAQAQAIVTELFQLILGRAPDPRELEAHAGRLVAGRLTEVDLVRSLVGSAEYGTAFSRSPSVARSLSTAILGNLARTDEVASIAAYANGLMGGMSVDAVIREVTASPDGRQNSGVASPATRNLHGGGSPAVAFQQPATPAPNDMDQMIEGLIIGRMIGEGAVLGLPPSSAGERTPASPEQLVSLIRTLDMLADRPRA